MRILVVGATGTIGRAVVAALSPRHEIVAVSRRTRPGVEIAAPASIRALYAEVGPIDAVVSAAGAARFGPLAELDDEAFSFSLANKLMGQVNLVRLGLEHVRDRGSFVLTGGVLSRSPMKGSAAISLVNAALEGFVRAAALEAPRGIRVNVVSPPWVTDTLRALGMDPAPGLPPSAVAQAYVEAVEGTANGTVLEPSR
jgi:NAD(P)-dependent dehydrogenase (short-subunit alcohol dehydrogenase family)